MITLHIPSTHIPAPLTSLLHSHPYTYTNHNTVEASVAASVPASVVASVASVASSVPASVPASVAVSASASDSSDIGQIDYQLCEIKL